ncbi:hypothetical protein CcaCcLH18_00703 [Colletotrichum camelliae]|nr:hypothetical protein CcaCcLH18_00703 [Colletotrichum camelliae]
MQGLLLRGALVTLFMLLWFRSANSQCIFPDDQGIIKQYIVVVDQTPVRLSAAICSNTTITVAGTTVPVTNAPTLLLSDFIVENTITYTSTLSPSATFDGPVSTITRGLPQGTALSTVIFGPQESSGVGTEIILEPVPAGQQGPFSPQSPISSAYDPAQSVSGSIPDNAFPERFEIITAPWTGTMTSTLVLPPQGTDGIERQIILTPSSALFPGPITAATIPGTGTITTTLTIPPIGTDSVALQLVLTPTDAAAPSGGAPAGLFTTLTAVGTEPTTSTIVLPPAGSNTVGTEIIVVPTPAGDDDPDIFPAVYVPTTATGPGTLTTTFTIPPAGTDTTGTLLIIDPAPTPSTSTDESNDDGNGSSDPALTPSPSTGGSNGGENGGSDDGPLDAFFGPFTTITAPFTGLASTTIDLPPSGGDGTGTRVILTPTPQLRPFNGPVIRIAATVTGTVFTTVTILPALADGTATAIVINPANTDPGVVPSGNLPGTAAVIPAGPTGPPDFGVLDPSSGPADPVLPAIVSPVVPGVNNIFTSTFAGSVTSTTTFPPGPSGQPDSTVILVPSSVQVPINTASIPVDPALFSSTNGGQASSATTGPANPSDGPGSTVPPAPVPVTSTGQPLPSSLVPSQSTPPAGGSSEVPQDASVLSPTSPIISATSSSAGPSQATNTAITVVSSSGIATSSQRPGHLSIHYYHQSNSHTKYERGQHFRVYDEHFGIHIKYPVNYYSLEYYWSSDFVHIWKLPLNHSFFNIVDRQLFHIRLWYFLGLISHIFWNHPVHLVNIIQQQQLISNAARKLFDGIQQYISRTPKYYLVDIYQVILSVDILKLFRIVNLKCFYVICELLGNTTIKLPCAAKQLFLNFFSGFVDCLFCIVDGYYIGIFGRKLYIYWNIKLELLPRFEFFFCVFYIISIVIYVLIRLLIRPLFRFLFRLLFRFLIRLLIRILIRLLIRFLIRFLIHFLIYSSLYNLIYSLIYSLLNDILF